MPKYNPNKQYKWEETDVFELTGNQFGLILNALRNALAKPAAQEVMLMMKAEAELTKVLAEGVEDGFVKEHREHQEQSEEEDSPRRRKKLNRV